MEIFWTILRILGALGFFMYGMKVMSEGIQNAAGDTMRKALRTMTQNRVLGVFVGFIITALLQSSSATTVMTVSFVNAGLLTLVESAGVMMGANIGTTITGWLVNIVGKFKIATIALPIIGIGFPMLFSNKGNWKYWGQFLIGFALLFMGLSELKDSVPELGPDSSLVQFFTKFSNYGILTSILFVGLGTLITVIMQSSSASMTLTLALVMAGVIPFNVGAAMILGENIGTTITAELASLVANVNAKRSARIHSLFNIIGVSWMILALPIFLKYVIPGVTKFAGNLMGLEIGNGNPFEDPHAASLGLAVFHTVFNATNVLLLLPFVPWLVRLAEKSVKAEDDDVEEFKLKYISSGFLNSPSLALENAKKEIEMFSTLIFKMNGNINALFFEKQKNPEKLIKKIKNREDITDNIDLEISDYLTKISEGDLTKSNSSEIRGMLSTSNDLERIGDIIYEMSKNYERLKRENVELPPNATEELKELMIYTTEAVVLMKNHIDGKKDKFSLEQIINTERKINKCRKKIFTEHFTRLESGVYTARAGVIFIDFVNRAERIGDHCMNIHEALYNKNDLFEAYEKKEQQ